MPITFTCSVDDGHPSDLKMAGLLHRHGLQATFFIPIKNQEGYPVMSPSQMRLLSQDFEIGSHTIDHCYLPSLSLAKARYQIFEGKQKLEDILGKTVSGFCYPGGRFHKTHIDMVKRAGFHYARTTTNLSFSAGTNRFEIPTTCQFFPHQKAVYVRNFIRAMHWSERQAGLRTVLQQDSWIKRMYALFEYAHQNGSIFHMWVHSHNIDDFNLWSELDAFLGHVAANVKPDQSVTNGQLASRFFSH
jgi:peptidoglycan/xylan/chitin deacetylase (PgdA/CDA1 family)